MFVDGQLLRIKKAVTMVNPSRLTNFVCSYTDIT